MSRRNAFTLIDLMALFVVCGLLLVVVCKAAGRDGTSQPGSAPASMPGSRPASGPASTSFFDFREKSRQATCQANLSSISKSIAMYSASSSDQWPFPLLQDSGDPNDNSAAQVKTDDALWSKTGANNLGDWGPNNFCVMMAQGLSGPGAFRCPSDTKSTKRTTEANYGWGAVTEVSYSVHYTYDIAATGEQPARLSDSSLPSSLVIMADRNPGGANMKPVNHPSGGFAYVRRDTTVGFFRSTTSDQVMPPDNIYAVQTAAGAGPALGAAAFGVPVSNTDSALNSTGRAN